MNDRDNRENTCKMDAEDLNTKAHWDKVVLGLPEGWKKSCESFQGTL